MDSIRALHQAADAARAALRLARGALADANTPQTQDAYRMAFDAKTEAEFAVYEATYDLDSAVRLYPTVGEAHTAQYDRLVAAVLACHATDHPDVHRAALERIAGYSAAEESLNRQDLMATIRELQAIAWTALEATDGN